MFRKLLDRFGTRLVQTARTIEPHFDADFYLQQYPDLASWRANLLRHYVLHGWRENRRPTASFDTGYYRTSNTDIPPDMNPFEHYVTIGKNQGRKSSNDPLFLYTFELEKEEGVTPARRPSNQNDFAIAVPFHAPLPQVSTPRVAAIVHAFYPELLEELLGYLANVPARVDLFISTDTPEKERVIRQSLASYDRGSSDIRVFPNRGRDIAPFIVGFRDVFEKYEIFVHLHTKRSPHGGGPLAGWRSYLLQNLLGSQKTVESILFLLETTRIGIVFPQHLYVIRGILNWGYDFELASGLLERAGFRLDKDLVLEFPSGSMFWGKCAALRSLLNLNLSFEDFPEEAAQIDGTLAHAIERTFLMFAELTGFRWAKVIDGTIKYPLPECVLPIWRLEDLEYAITKTYRPLLVRPTSGETAVQRAIPETRELTFYPSEKPRPRLNLLVPTINQRQVFGGVGTALAIFEELADRYQTVCDFRVVVTDAALERSSMARLPGFTEMPLGAADNGPGRTIVDATERSVRPLPVRSFDVFIATAWWTATLGNQARQAQSLFFGRSRDLVYLIQDDEPYFYGWSSKWSLADATYGSGDNTIAIVNSEELAEHFAGRRFKQILCLPYQMNRQLRKLIEPRPRSKRILFYGRPSVLRNAFELALDGLFLWQQRNPVAAREWQIFSVGEEYSADWALPVQNVVVLGKLTLDEYAFHLSTASVGLSLMLSPHPSYPPLEMAEAGLVTVTNAFADKDLTRRFSNVRSIDPVTPDTIAEALNVAVREVSNGNPADRTISDRSEPGVPNLPSSSFENYSAERLADLIGLTKLQS